MNKQDVIKELNNAKNAHVLWFANAMALSVGTDPGDSSVPKKHTECTFGKWYYGVGQENNNIDAYKAIDDVHKKLHDKYNEIFNEFEKLDSEGFFEDISLRGSQKQKDFNSSINDLKDISKELLEILSQVESELQN